MSELGNEWSAVRELAPTYFRNPKGYFWRWVEKGSVVEWRNGNTLCYREELAHVLRSLTEQGLPPLASVLLLLAACADTWPASGDTATMFRHLRRELPVEPTDPSEAELERQYRHVLQFLDVVAALPANLRTGVPKLHLFREVFSAQVPQVSTELAQALIDEWESGRADAALHFSRRQISRREVLTELDCLAGACNRFPTTEALALHLRTGLDKIPEPLPELEPDPTPSEPEAPLPAGLLDQLTQDPRTAGLARLVQQLVAALRMPLHARGASDQPIGGVSDITNRGNFDRLLLSELAHDDLSLMARLVNNEALYLRREAPPRQDVRPRTILLDTTLRMWGVPRVFALAAALAWVRNSRQTCQPAPVAAFALGGQLTTPLDLETFNGVVVALGQLDPAPDAGPALLDFSRTQAAGAGDCLFITDAQLLQKPDFAGALAEASPALRFLLTVDRSGELHLYEYQNGHRALVSTARYDLEETLFAPAPRRPLPLRLPTDGPAFLQHVPAPLYLPVTGLRMSIKNTFYVPSLGVLAIVDTRRVLYWSDKGLGAREVLPVIEAGTYYFGTSEGTYLSILVSGPHCLQVYLFAPATQEVNTIDLSAELVSAEAPVRVVYQGGGYYVQQAGKTFVFDCRRWCLLADSSNSVFPSAVASAFRPDFGHLKRHVNNGYNVLLRVNRLEVNGLGELVVEGHELRLISHSASLSHGLHLMSSSSSDRNAGHRVKATPDGTLTLTPNEQVLFRRFTWPDGSTAVVDSRGLLHLRSADATVPEISLLLILGKPTAAWAADGTVCGPVYFTGPNPAQSLPAAEFNRQYLQRFIAQLG